MKNGHYTTLEIERGMDDRYNITQYNSFRSSGKVMYSSIDLFKEVLKGKGYEVGSASFVGTRIQQDGISCGVIALETALNLANDRWSYDSGTLLDEAGEKVPAVPSEARDLRMKYLLSKLELDRQEGKVLDERVEAELGVMDITVMPAEIASGISR